MASEYMNRRGWGKAHGSLPRPLQVHVSGLTCRRFMIFCLHGFIYLSSWLGPRVVRLSLL
jgi:hypothetical protein